MRPKLQEILHKFEQIELDLQNPSTLTQPSEIERLGRARAELSDLVDVIRRLAKVEDDLQQAEAMLDDSEMREMAAAEIPILREMRDGLDQEVKLMLIPKDPNDDKSVIIEIRPAAGGDEAGLFASDLFRLYTRYAERRRWKMDVVEHEETGLGSLSRVVFSIEAKGAYSQLKHESGVHRVQRVPATESGGRIHTSTVTVAVLPEAEEVDVQMRDEDVEVSTFRSSSAGGQHMQKNETAIRVVHKPSGIVVTCQDERSQAQNKLKAMAVLRTKLYEAEQERLSKERGTLRRGLIGSGDRSEKIRTYNFPQSRITDHRIGMDMHNMTTFLDGDIQPLIDALVQEEQAQKLLDAEQSTV